MPERAAVNETIQLGLETTLGTAVPANRLMAMLEMVPDLELDPKAFAGQGRQQAAVALSNKDFVTGKYSSKGNDGDAVSYIELLYIMSALMGRPTPTTHPTGTNVKDWLFDAPLTGDPANPVATYTAQQGSAARAHQYAGTIFTGIQIKGTRDGVSMSGSYVAQKVTDGATLTASPTRLNLDPVLGADWTVYRDATNGALGTTQLLRVFEWTYTYEGVWAVLWPGNKVASNNTWATIVRMYPKHELELKQEADAQGMAALTDARAGTTEFIRIDMQGRLFTAADGTLGAGDSALSREIKMDMAAKVTDKIGLADGNDLLEATVKYTVVDDVTWQHAAQITVTNLITAL